MGIRAGGMTEPHSSGTPLLELRHISLEYGRTRVVDDVSLTIGEGELVCLLGPSGCGKTSTLRIASGVERQTSGEVLVDGVEISGASRHDPPEARQIGLMFQDFALFPHMTVLANVAFGLKALERTERRKTSLEALDRMGIGHLAEAYPDTLSGGEQQRVALCRALAPKPRIMLMDEPFSGLDRGLRDTVREDTRKTLRLAGASGLLVTHDADEAMRIADRIILMRKGKFVQVGAPYEIYSNPADLESAELFSEINKLEATVHKGSVETPLGVFRSSALEDGTKVDVVLRYSDFQVSDRPNEGAYSLSVVIKKVRFMGSESLAEFADVGGKAIYRGRFPSSVSLTPGERTAFQISPDKVLIFRR